MNASQFYHRKSRMLTHIQRMKTWQSFLSMICVNKIYGSGKCCNKENKEKGAYELYVKELSLFVNKLGFWTCSSDYKKAC